MPRTASFDFEPGAIFAGKYRVERILASGGQGTIAVATHLRLHQPVALKVAHSSENLEPEAIERLFREARATFRLTSEHIARIFDVDVERGVPFIVMEYLEGRDLKALLAECGQLTCAEAVGLLVHAIDGIAEAHDAGIIHRDLKPSNLFVQQRPDGTPLLKVLDFGVSKANPAASRSDEVADLTAPLRMLGTPRYMAPEQACDARAASAASDIWALGLILQEMLTVSPVFRARNEVEELAQILTKSPTPVSLIRPDVPPEIERILLRCLQKDPEHRFADVRELAEQLAPFVPPWATIELARLRRSGRATHRADESNRGDSTPAPGVAARPVERSLGRIVRRSTLAAVGIVGLSTAAAVLFAPQLRAKQGEVVSDNEIRSPSADRNTPRPPLVQALVLPTRTEASRSESHALARASQSTASVHTSSLSTATPRPRNGQVPRTRRNAVRAKERGARGESVVAASQQPAAELTFDPLDSRK